MVPRWDSECCVGSQIALLSIGLHEDPPKMLTGRSSGESMEIKGKPRQHPTISHGSKPRWALYSSLITHVPHVWNKWKTICKKVFAFLEKSQNMFMRICSNMHRHLYKNMLKIMRKSCNIYPKLIQNPSKINKIRSLGRFGAFSAPFRAQVGSRTLRVRTLGDSK